eukprot:GHVU01151489.1.p1 GENE.GHVU01151489.1~~GHVU01151489.1.p1  ORF type:complete len:350 (+),score=7.58 GHVU01151489.1:130-1050(+)
MATARRVAGSGSGGSPSVSRNDSGSSSPQAEEKGSGSKNLRPADPEEDPGSLALKQFVNDDRHFSLVRNFRVADVITIMNGVCGALSIFCSCQFLVTLDLSYLHKACLFPVLSLGFDFLDGKVARYRGESSALGQELDSLADLISFGVAPSVVGYCIGLRHPVDIAILTFFICAGLTRLARFNSTAAFKPPPSATRQPSAPSSFEGLPIPTSLGLIAGMYECIRRGQISLPRNSQILHQLLRLDPVGVESRDLEKLLWIEANGNELYGGLIQLLESRFGLKVHWLSVIFGTWALFMLSKTLKVPKI